MIPSPFHFRYAFAMLLVAGALTGCGKSNQDAAIEQARIQAASTGQAQQVVSTDKNGNTVTTVVQPPKPGQQGQVVTTTVTPSLIARTASGAPSNSVQTSTSAPMPVPKVHVSAGTTLIIRIDQRISVKSSRAGDRFTGELVEPVVDGNNSVVIPKGSLVGGVVAVSHRRGHFKGASNLDLRLTSLTLNGTQYPLGTNDLRRRKKGKGKRSFAMIGGGTGLGMLVGGLATGGTGLVVGGLVGGGAGTAAAGLTGNRDLEIPAESVVRFKLADELVIDPS